MSSRMALGYGVDDWARCGSIHEEGFTGSSPAAKIMVPNPLLAGHCAIEKLMGKIGPRTGAEANLGKLL